VEHWNGTSWNVVSSPNPSAYFNFLYAATAISPSDVWAVGGTFNTLVEHWNGTSWNFVPSPSPGTYDNKLYGVTAISSSDVWAVGTYSNNSGWDYRNTLVEHYSTSGCNMPIGGPISFRETLGGFNFCIPCLMNAIGRFGQPVNTSTGNFYHTFSDFAIAGRGMPLNFSHTYNSLTANKDGPLGFGWTGSYGMSLSVAPGTGVVTVTQETGSQVVFTPTNQNNYTAPPRVIATLIRNGDGTYTLTRGARDIITFSSTGQLLAERDLNGYTTTFTYNGNGQLATVTDSAGRSLTFGYAGSHLTSVTDPLGRQVLFAYNDGQGNLTDVTDVGGGNNHFTYDPNHLMLTMRDPNGGVVTNHYDTSGRVDWQEDQLHRRTTFAYTQDTTTITDAQGNVTLEQYAFGLRVAVTKGYGTPQAATWQFTYDPATVGITSVIDPDGHVTTTTYDANANPLTVTDALNRQTVNTYDTLNDLTSTTDPNGITTTMQYDAAGNLLSRSRPLVGSGRPQVTTNHYADSAHPGDVTWMTDPDYQIWTYAYDTYGNLTSATDPMGDQTTNVFNTIGWMTSQTSPLGNPGGNPAYTTTFDHDAFGDVTTVTDPLQHRTISHYDPNRNLDTFTDANSHTTRYVYDAANELTSVVRPDTVTLRTDYNPDGTMAHQYDGAGRATSYGYNSLAQLISVTDPLSRTTSYTYDGVGNLLTKTDPQSPPQTTTYTYDAVNQLTAITYSDGVTPNVTNIAYDGDGQRLQMTDGTDTTTWAYDSLNRLTSATDGVSSTVGYGYDLKGQLTSITYPGAQLVSRNYDAAGRLHTVQDWLGNVTTFRYDRNSNLVRENLPPGTGITDKFAYDTANRLAGIRYSKSGTAQATIFYGRDSADLLTTMTSTGVLNNNSETYGYTPVNQLNTVNAASYAYDNADNITALTSGASLQYDTANELTSLTHNSITTTFNFDPRGNRTLMTPPSGPATNYSYDQANRLTAYNNGNPPTAATYTYNGVGLRMSKTVGGILEPFVWDVAEGLPLLLKDGTTRYIYGPGTLPLETIDASGQVLYYHHDQLGSTRLLTNSSGAAAATYTYDAYGNVTASTGNVANPFGYAGQYTDAESGMQYLRARYYDPSTAQFISRDPITTLTRNPYGYVGGSPLNRTDASGLCSWNPFDSDSCEIAVPARAVGNFADNTAQFFNENAPMISNIAGVVQDVAQIAIPVCIVLSAGACILPASAIALGAGLLRVRADMYISYNRSEREYAQLGSDTGIGLLGSFGEALTSRCPAAGPALSISSGEMGVVGAYFGYMDLWNKFVLRKWN